MFDEGSSFKLQGQQGLAPCRRALHGVDTFSFSPTLFSETELVTAR
jgi:hypothetical protein